jgi:selenide,water dikinase
VPRLGLGARIAFAALPLLEGVADLAQVPYRTGAAVRNWASYGEEVALTPAAPEWQRDLLCDPQTSGGLLIAVAPEGANQVLEALHTAGFDRAVVVGEMREGRRGSRSGRSSATEVESTRHCERQRSNPEPGWIASSLRSSQ